MNRVFDNNGSFLSQSTPKKLLRTVKKTFSVDSGDRNKTLYPTNAEFVVYLPRVYENIVSIRLKTGIFPCLESQGQGTAIIHAKSDGSTYTNDAAVSPTPSYFLISIEGLNKTDECALEANKSSSTDSYFALIPNVFKNTGDNLYYSDHSNSENISKYYPPIGKLDRLKISTKFHAYPESVFYWTSDGTAFNPVPSSNIMDYVLQFEIEYLDNGFDDFSAFETRLAH